MIRTSSHCDSGACVGVERHGANVTVHQLDGGNSSGRIVVTTAAWKAFTDRFQHEPWIPR